ncbi:MAG: DUF1273 family protein [Alistipes sp.]|nr:DUF1273 family protein [Alistipes sp.]
MAYDREITACFTGHRTYDGSRNSELERAIRELYALGYRNFLSGMAIGFDIEAAEVALALREKLAGLRIVAVVPFEGMQKGFLEADRTRFERIVAEADETVTLAPKYSVEVYAVRNNFLVDNASACIAYFDGSKGGTAYTVRRAVKSLLRLTNLYHNPQGKLF